MGIPGAGKSRIAEEYVARDYLRLNRDERGGSLRELAAALDEELAAGARRVVLDNTYLTRASRSYVIETANRHRAEARCIWLDTPLAQAQVNLVERLLERFGALPSPEKLRELARREPGVLAPTSQMRAFRELEPPSTDEGFAEVEAVPFEREPSRTRSRVASSRPPRWGSPVGSTRSRSSTGMRLTWSSTGARAAIQAELAPWRPASRPSSPGRSRAHCARTAAARRPAGAGRRFPGCRSRSRGRTASTRRARFSWEPRPRTERSRRRSAPATSALSSDVAGTGKRRRPCGEAGCCGACRTPHEPLARHRSARADRSLFTYFAGFAGPLPSCTFVIVNSPGWSTMTNETASDATRYVRLAEANAVQLG